MAGKKQRTKTQQVLDGLNKGLVADTLGAPVDLVALGINAPIMGASYLGRKMGLLDAPLRTIDKPVGGSEFFSDLMARAGVVSKDEDATLIEDAVRFGSGIVGPAGVMKAPQVAAATGKAVKKGAVALGQKGADMAEDYLVKQGLAKPIFIGENAKTWNAANAARAVELEKAGAPATHIWKQTGTWRAPDGKLRQEISDHQARLLSPVEMQAKADAMRARNVEIKQQIADSKAYPDLFPKELTAAQRQLRTEAKLNKGLLDDAYGPESVPDVLGNRARFAYDHPALFEAYPELQNVVVRRDVDLGPGVGGRMAPGELTITREGMRRMNPSSIMAHEMQHAVQGIEGFAQGGSPSTMRPAQFAPAFRQRMETAKDSGDFQGFNQARREGAMDAYRRLHGEAEARATEDRLGLGRIMRQQTFPRQSYDVPQRDLIIEGLLGSP